MLGRAHRFHGYNSLRSVYKHGRNVRSDALSLRYSFRDPNKPYRVAVVVSRKTSKSAVVRNRIRRRIYALVRESDSIMTPGTDLVFSVFSDDISSLSAGELQKTVRGLLEKTQHTPTSRH